STFLWCLLPRPRGLTGSLLLSPRLAPWAEFLRRFAALPGVQTDGGIRMCFGSWVVVHYFRSLAELEVLLVRVDLGCLSCLISSRRSRMRFSTPSFVGR